MALTPQQQHQIKETFTRIAMRSQTTGEVFYTRLFKRYPDIAALFAENPVNQGRKFMHFLSILVTSLNSEGTLAANVEEVAHIHGRLALKPEHLQAFKETFLWTLEHVLVGLTRAEQEAWGALYDMIAERMMSGKGSE